MALNITCKYLILLIKININNLILRQPAPPEQPEQKAPAEKAPPKKADPETAISSKKTSPAIDAVKPRPRRSKLPMSDIPSHPDKAEDRLVSLFDDFKD